jgi:alpha-beta hydrolase superfamily lysophospholipase
VAVVSDARPVLNVHAPDRPEAVVLVLHGGRESSLSPVRARQLAVLRMLPFATRIARRGGGRVAVARLRYRVRGWNAENGQEPMPVTDARWALDEMAERFPGLPVGLVGHSMGGRTALRVAGGEQVQGVVGLAPWLNAGEPVEQLRGRRTLLVHGTADRMTSPAATVAFAERLKRAGDPAALVLIDGAKHSMLRQPRLWHELAAQFVLDSVLPDYAPSEWRGAPNDWQQMLRAPARLTY